MNFNHTSTERAFPENQSGTKLNVIYYAEGQHVAGQWFGKGAEDLGLRGVTTTEQFERLCENLHPQTGEKLTLRQNGTRIETGKNGVAHETANRRVFYDFPFSPPKSVSIAALVGNDTRIVQAHAITSYASQGKSVNYVLFSDSAAKAATNNQQWYVTISRGKKGVQIFTCDKEELRENITRSGDRQLAIDIAPVKKEEKKVQMVKPDIESLRQRLRQSRQQRQSQSRGIGI